MKATTLLETQHREVEALFDGLKAGVGESSSDALMRLADALARHMVMEQNVLYPAVRELDPELVESSYEEHSLAELALKRLLRTDPDDRSFEAKLAVLEELVGRHVDEEEELLLPMLERELDDRQLELLGRHLEEAYLAACGEPLEALLPQGLAATSADEARDTLAEPASIAPAHVPH